MVKIIGIIRVNVNWNEYYNFEMKRSVIFFVSLEVDGIFDIWINIGDVSDYVMVVEEFVIEKYSL